MSIIAIDPGITTGVAIHNEVYSTLVVHRWRDLWALFDTHVPEVVVFEDFRTPGLISKDGLQTVRLIGAIEAVTYRMNIPTVLQFPLERTKFINAAKGMLRTTGRKFLVHETDALAHLLLYEHRRDTNKVPTLRRTNKT